MISLLESIDQLQQKVKDIRLQNTLINIGSTLGGAAIGGYIGNEYNHLNTGIASGIVGSSILSNLVTSDREKSYISNVLYGPYEEEINNLISSCQHIIDHISEVHKDYSYKDKLVKLNMNFQPNKMELVEANISKIRKYIIKYLYDSLEVIHDYCQEKRALIQVTKIYKNELIPQFKTVEHYLLNAKVKI